MGGSSGFRRVRPQPALEADQLICHLSLPRIDAYVVVFGTWDRANAACRAFLAATGSASAIKARNYTGGPLMILT
ncbi:hypothetical protein KRM28CT15_26240 [Krasilnikovia sp. M28-CT-15]